MSGRTERLRDRIEENGPDKRLVALALLFLVVVGGAGIGTIAFDAGPGGNATEPTPTVVELTPVTPTPTPDPGGETPVPTATARPGTETTTATPRTATTADDDTETPTESPSTTAGRGGSGVALRATGSTVFARLSGVAPDEDGRTDVVFENSGSDPGTLAVADVTVTDHENSLLDPERAVGDDVATGELAASLRVRLSVTYPSGATDYRFGSAGGYVALADLDGRNATSNETLAGGRRATVAMEWRLPETVGNEVQSDRVTFDVAFVLRRTSP